MTNMQTLIQARDALDEAIESLKRADDRAPQQAAELLAENNRLKAEHEDAIRGQHKASVEACRLRSQVADLKAAQTPRPMSTAPKDEVVRLVFDGIANRRALHLSPVGWLPLPDQDKAQS